MLSLRKAICLGSFLIASTFSAAPVFAGGSPSLSLQCNGSSVTTLPNTVYLVTVFGNPGDTVNVTFTTPPQGFLFTPGTTGIPAQPAGAQRQFVIPAGQNGFRFEVFVGQSGTSTFSCAPPASPSMTQTQTHVAPDTGPVADASEATAFVSANTQVDAVNTNTRQASNRINGGSGIAATRNGVFLSSMGLQSGQSQLANPDWNAWVSADLRGLGDEGSGNIQGLAFGIDTTLGPDWVVGAVVSYNQIELEYKGFEGTSKATGYGAYFATRLTQNVFLDGFILTAKPRNEIDGGSFTSERTGAGVSVTGSMVMNTLLIEPSVGIRGYFEAAPSFTADTGRIASNDIRSTTGSIGARVSSAAPLGQGFTPFVDLALEFNQRDSDLNGNNSFTSPRLGFGFDYITPRGRLSVGLDGGRLLEDVTDYGGQVSYEFTF